jgi:regulator of protease activity HflC (stomatin/prohibitin superfamily)
MAQPNWEAIPIRRRNGLIFAFSVVFIVVVLFAIAASISIVNIGGDQAGIVTKKFGGGKLPSNRFIAVDGENGIQAKVLVSGWHFFYWPWQYDVRKVPLMEIKNGTIGLIQAQDGISLPRGVIYAPEWDDIDKMRDAEYFLSEGKGFKGPQLTVLKPGKYRINTELFKITLVPITDVKTGEVAVIKSNVGDVVDAPDRLVEVGQRGIWNKAYGEGQYYLNTNAYEVTIMNVQQVKVSYTTGIEPGERTANQPQNPIEVRTSDGYTFPVDVRLAYLIDRESAPKVVANIGDDELVLSKIVTPRVRDVFRNNASKVKALDYVQDRQQQGLQSMTMLKEKLLPHGITVLEISIGDVGDEKSLGSLLKTLTDREIALQEQITFQEQQRAAEQQKALMATEQEAIEEKRLATAAYDVKVAEEEKKMILIQAEAKAEMITLTAAAQAKAYEMIAEVIGEQNAALIELMKIIAESGIRITPEVMVGGSSGSGMTDALMGTILKDRLGGKRK